MSDDRPSNPMTAWWRFSLREIGLLVFGLSACLALIVQTLPHRTSSTIPELRVEELIKEIAAEHTLTVQTGMMSGGGSYSRKWIRDSHTVVVDIAPEEKPILIDNFHKRVLAQLEANHQKVVGTSESFTQPGKKLTEFAMWYEGWGVTGFIELYAIPVDETTASSQLKRFAITMRGHESAR